MFSFKSIKKIKPASNYVILLNRSKTLTANQTDLTSHKEVIIGVFCVLFTLGTGN